MCRRRFQSWRSDLSVYGRKTAGEKKIISLSQLNRHPARVLQEAYYAYDFCDTGMVCPLAKMYTLGSGFIPSPNHAGGLRYHGMSSTSVTAVRTTDTWRRVLWSRHPSSRPQSRFARVEGILPAPESSHAIKVAIDEAIKCKETGEEKTILFGLTGTGYFDMLCI